LLRSLRVTESVAALAQVARRDAKRTCGPWPLPASPQSNHESVFPSVLIGMADDLAKSAPRRARIVTPQL